MTAATEGHGLELSEAEVRTLAARSGMVLLRQGKAGGYMVFNTRTCSVIGGADYSLDLDTAASIVITATGGRA